MVGLPNIPLINRPRILKTDTANQYSQMAQEFVNAAKYKKADYEANKKEFLEYSYLKPEDLIFANFTKKQGDEIEKRVHKWTTMQANAPNGKMTAPQLLEMKLDRQSFDNWQKTIQTTLGEYKNAKEKVDADFKGDLDHDYFEEQQKRLINGELPTKFLEPSAKDPIKEGTKLLKDYPDQEQMPIIGASKTIGNTQYTSVSQDKHTEDQKKEAAMNIPVQSPGAAKSIFKQIALYKQNPDTPIQQDSKKRTLNQLTKEYDGLSNTEQANMNFTQFYSRETLWDKISPLDRKIQSHQLSGSGKMYSDNNPSIFKVTTADNKKGLFFTATPVPNKVFKYTGDAYDQTTGEKINLVNTTINRTQVSDKNGFIFASVVGNPYKFYMPNEFDPSKTESAPVKMDNGNNRLVRNTTTNEVLPIDEAESKVNSDNLKSWEVQDVEGNFIPATIKSEGSTKRENHLITIPVADDYVNNKYLTEGLDPNTFQFKDNYMQDYGGDWVKSAKNLPSKANYSKKEKAEIKNTTPTTKKDPLKLFD